MMEQEEGCQQPAPVEGDNPMGNLLHPVNYLREGRCRVGLMLILLMVFSCAARAQYTTASDNNGGLIITKYTGSGGAVVIPGTITVNGTAYPVTGIGIAAFYGNNSLTSVTLSTSVTSIGLNAFSECYDLTTVTIPNGVTSIGQNAFAQCGSLTTVTIPNSVTSIGEDAFGYCGNLASVTIGNGVTSIEDSTFYECTGLTSITIGSSVTSIGDYAFQYCSSLSGVTIPNSVTSIGEGTFYDCTALTSALIGGSVTSIGEGAFNDCTSLTSMTIPAGVTSLGSGPFDGCTSLASITVSAQNTAYSSIGGVLFNLNHTTLIQYPGGLAGSYTIPSSVISIGNYAFQSCASLTSVTIPSSVTSIGDEAFEYSTQLTSVTIPNSVTSVGDDAFYGCTSLTSAVFLGNAPTMGNFVFGFGPTVTNFTVYYYNGASGFTSPTWTIGVNDFYPAINAGNPPTPIPAPTSNAGPFTVTPDFNGGLIITGYTGTGGAVAIPGTITVNGVTYPVTGIGASAFFGSTLLTSITMPASLISIASQAFQGCVNLTSVTIGSGVTSIGDDAFEGCTGLTAVLIPDNVTSLGSDPFQGCTGLSTLRIGNGISSLTTSAFNGCTSLTSVTIPASVTSFGTFVFYGCSSMTSAVFLGNAPTLAGADFDSTATGFTVYYHAGATGFTSPMWNGYAAVNVGNVSDGISLSGNLAFSLVTIHTSATGTLNIINSGNAPITVSSISYPSGFSGNWAGGTISAGAVQSVTVTFAPTSVVAYGGSITVNSSASSSTKTIAASGMGVNPGPFTIASDGNGGIIITGYTGSAATLVIPGTINGLTVTEIGNDAFRTKTSLVSVTIPDSVTSIGSEAFENCPVLIHVNIGNSVVSVGELAFFDCPELDDVIIPSSVTSLGFNAFSGCGSLTNAYFNGNAPTMGGNVFASAAENFRVDYGGTGFTTPTWAASPSDTYPAVPYFATTTSNGQVTITGYNGPGGAVTIGTINGLPVSSIGAHAFAGTTSLTSVSISAGVTNIGTAAFAYCSDLTAITVNPSNPAYSSVNGVLFDKNQTMLVQYPGGLTGSYTIPSSTTSIGQQAFQNAVGLTGVTIPSSVINIGAGAYAGCTGLSSVTLPASVTSIGDQAFSYCPSLSAAIFQGNAPTMGFSVFLAVSSSFKVSYFHGATGFTSPAWTDSSGDTYASEDVGANPEASAQTITFPAITPQVVGTMFETGASASSGLPLYYTSTGPVKISDNIITLTGVGTVSIRAHQDGDASYTAATSVLHTFTVSQGSQTITFPAVATQYFDGALTLAATASSGLAVSYTFVSGPATLTGNHLAFTGVGTVVVQASQAGTTNYAAATSVMQTITVAPAPQTLTFPAIGNQTVGATITLEATASSGLPIYYTSSGNVTISGATAKFIGVGPSTQIRAHQDGDADHLAATSVVQTFAVNQGSQTISFPAVPTQYFGGALTLAAAASSGLAVSYTYISGPATLAANKLTFTGIGTVMVKASQAGNANYAAAMSMTQTITVAPDPQTITFPVIVNKVYPGASFPTGATASSGLAITYTSTGPSKISGNMITLTGVGTVNIRAHQDGDPDYTAATSVLRTFTVTNGP